MPGLPGLNATTGSQDDMLDMQIDKLCLEDYPQLTGPVMKTIMCGELLELRIEVAWFQKNYIWEPHLFALTNIGIFKFERSEIGIAPTFLPLKEMTVDLLPCDNKNPGEMIFKIGYKPSNSQSEIEVFLSSEHQDQIVDWINCIKLAVNKFNPQLFKSKSQVKIGMGAEIVSSYNTYRSS